MSESLVFWSGGLDSTLALYDLAKGPGWRTAGYHGGKVEHSVRAISIDSESIANNDAQRAARVKIRAKFDELGLLIEYLNMKIDGVWFRGASSTGSNQAPLWIGQAAGVLKPDENLVLGLVEDDGGTFFAGDMIAAFNALQKLGGKSGSLVFPHLSDGLTKAHVLARSRERGFADLCVWCQVPKDGKPCKGTRCTPCVRYAQAAWAIDQPFWAKYLKRDT